MLAHEMRGASAHDDGQRVAVDEPPVRPREHPLVPHGQPPIASLAAHPAAGQIRAPPRV